MITDAGDIGDQVSQQLGSEFIANGIKLNGDKQEKKGGNDKL